jgi:adenine-specific DNA-methyltransferase
VSYRYIGNKTRFLKQLMSAISDLAQPGQVVADLMCGTAAVSEALRTSGYKVIASDLMTFSAQHATVRLTLDSPPSFSKLGGSYFAVLDHLQSLRPVEGYMTREYSPAGRPTAGCPPRMYLSESNARLIDAINRQLNIWNAEGLLTHQERCLLRHDLVLATNRIANIAGTYGHYRSKWSNGALSRLLLLPAEFVWGFSCDHVVMQGPAESVSQGMRADLCYIDPPYMKRQYAANYHLIETIARGDEPEAIGVSGLRPWRDQYSDFCSKLRIRDAFTKIIRGMNCPKFLISYSEDGLLSKEELLALLRQFGDAELSEYNVPRFRSNNSPLDRTMSEYLLTLKRPDARTSCRPSLPLHPQAQRASDAR